MDAAAVRGGGNSKDETTTTTTSETSSSLFSSNWLDYVSSTTAYSSNGYLEIQAPRLDGSVADEDNVLFLFLSRTDDWLPYSLGSLDGWEPLGADCYKSKNYQSSCHSVVNGDCVTSNYTDGYSYCTEFDDGTDGTDLATVVFYRSGGSNSYKSTYEFDLPGWGEPSWAVMLAVSSRLVDVSSSGKPVVVDVATTSCDDEYESVFPSVVGDVGDLLLLHMSNDDSESEHRFQPPHVADAMIGYVTGHDETGILYGGILEERGSTGEMWTQGEGSSACKDNLISITLRRRQR